MKIIRIPVGGLRTNCYIGAIEDDCAFVIDPGAEPEKILEKLDSNALTLELILLTHGHYDHTGALEILSEATGCKKIYIGEEDKELLEDSKKSCADTVGQKSVDLGKLAIFTVKEEINLGQSKITVIKTPGHTKGSVCFLVGDVLFSGDTLFRNDVGRTDMYGGDRAQLESSLEKLLRLPGDLIVCPGHGLKTKIENERHLSEGENRDGSK